LFPFRAVRLSLDKAVLLRASFDFGLVGAKGENVPKRLSTALAKI
jgi:hypothetical protein